jgi:predicted alpha/beta superfamily hydrolase
MYKKLLLLLGLVMATALTQAQTIKNKNITIGHVDSIASVVLKEKRQLWVYVPASARDLTYLPQRYPVVYLLDGDAFFASTTGMIGQLSEGFLTNVFPEMIVVGILNTDRMRDFTPAHVTSSAVVAASGLKTSGGGENFTTFLAQELIPYIDTHYPTSPHRTLVGHSLGGLLVLNTLVHHTSLFDNYVALDPSVLGRGTAAQANVRGASPAPVCRPVFVRGLGQYAARWPRFGAYTTRYVLGSDDYPGQVDPARRSGP